MTIPKGFILRDEGGNPVFKLLNDVNPLGVCRAEDVKSLNGENVAPQSIVTPAQAYAMLHATEQFLASTNQ